MVGCEIMSVNVSLICGIMVVVEAGGRDIVRFFAGFLLAISVFTAYHLTPPVAVVSVRACHRYLDLL